MNALTALHCRTDPGQFSPESFRPRTPQPKSFVFSGVSKANKAIILISTLALVSKSKGMSASTTLKKECYTLKDCKGVSSLKGMPGSATIKQTARKYN